MNTIKLKDRTVEVSFGIVTQAPFTGRHKRSRTFEISCDGVRQDLLVDNGRRVGGRDGVPLFENTFLRKCPAKGDRVCLDKDSGVWGFRRFYDKAVGSTPDAIVEDPDRDLLRVWRETPPEEIALFAAGRNTGVSHRHKFAAQAS